MDPRTLAQELAAAYRERRPLDCPTAQDASFDLPAAYAVEAELARMRAAGGHSAVGRKVGFANKAMWRALKLDTLVWAHMYDHTVRYAEGGDGTLAIASMTAPKIEPEIVFKMRAPGVAGDDPAAVLGAVEWVALGFEIIDCVFPDWKFQPADFVASFGLHAALVVGTPLPVTPENIPALVEALPRFKVKLSKNGEVVDEGSGKNALRSPALCLGELASALLKQPGAGALGAGELVSSGTLTTSMPMAVGDTWRAEVEGIDLPPIALRVTN